MGGEIDSTVYIINLYNRNGGMMKWSKKSETNAQPSEGSPSTYSKRSAQQSEGKP